MSKLMTAEELVRTRKAHDCKKTSLPYQQMMSYWR